MSHSFWCVCEQCLVDEINERKTTIKKEKSMTDEEKGSYEMAERIYGAWKRGQGEEAAQIIFELGGQERKKGEAKGRIAGLREAVKIASDTKHGACGSKAPWKSKKKARGK